MPSHGFAVDAEEFVLNVSSTAYADWKSNIGSWIPLRNVTNRTCDAWFYYEETIFHRPEGNAEYPNYSIRCEFEDGAPGKIEPRPCDSKARCDAIFRFLPGKFVSGSMTLNSLFIILKSLCVSCYRNPQDFMLVCIVFLFRPEQIAGSHLYPGKHV
jgi:hypothetical protein